MIANKLLNYLFYSVVLGIVLIIATAHYLPMLDLPQHAGQVQAFKSMFWNDSTDRWFDTVEINYFTPYWIGYFSIFLISFLVPIQSAINIIVAISFFLFVICFVQIRKKFDGPKFLDWILIPSFFGFSYQFGLLTFTLSISIGILLLLQTLRYIENRSKSSAALIICLGIVLYFSHLLIFLFFCMISVALIMTHKKQNWKNYVCLLLPFCILGLLIPMYFILPSILGQANLDGYFNEATHSSFKYGSLSDRLDYLFIYQWALTEDDYKPFSLLTLTLGVLILPFLAGCRLSKKIYKYAPLICFMIIWFGMPEHLFHTTFVYQRFSIFFIPFYILIFERSSAQEVKINMSRIHQGIIGLWIVLAVGLVILPIKDIFAFNEEVKDFDELLVDLPENQLAMSLVYSGGGGYAAKNRRQAPLYVYFPVWYQVAKNGWVEYNFAWFSPQIIRYKVDKVPENIAGFAWNPWMFSQFKSCDYYDMIIIYKPNQDFNQQFKQSTCSHKPFKQKGDWVVYKSEN